MNKEEFINDILKKKKETGVRILAHIYQPPEILELADVVGDSFKLAEMAQVMGDTVIVCGVRFMAETIKILSPNKTVILASPEATCPMAEQITPEYIRKFKKKNPDVAVCAYINTTAKLKEEADVCVTSSSAVKICKNIENDKILFIPDKNLGSYVAKAVPEKKFALVDGFCPIHNQLTANDVLVLKQEHPLALFAVHPEAHDRLVDTQRHGRDEQIGRLHQQVDHAVLSFGEHTGIQRHEEKHQQLGAEGADGQYQRVG